MIRQLKNSRALLTAGAVGLGLVLSACSPVTTDKPYAASDGVRGQLGDVSVENLMILSMEKGAPGRLLGAVSNASGEPGGVVLGPAGSGLPLPLGPNETINFFTHETLLLPSMPVAPGQVYPLEITNEAGESITVSVPVLDGTLPEYTEFVPTAEDLEQFMTAG